MCWSVFAGDCVGGGGGGGLCRVLQGHVAQAQGGEGSQHLLHGGWGTGVSVPCSLLCRVLPLRCSQWLPPRRGSGWSALWGHGGVLACFLGNGLRECRPSAPWLRPSCLPPPQGHGRRLPGLAARSRPPLIFRGCPAAPHPEALLPRPAHVCFISPHKLKAVCCFGVGFVFFSGYFLIAWPWSAFKRD